MSENPLGGNGGHKLPTGVRNYDAEILGQLVLLNQRMVSIETWLQNTHQLLSMLGGAAGLISITRDEKSGTINIQARVRTGEKSMIITPRG